MEILDIDVVINLALPTSSNALQGEAEMVTMRGLVYLQIPVEWESPQLEAFEQFVGALDLFKGKRLWVHCAKNMRVSAFLYLYRRLVLLESEERAQFPMNEIWTPNPIWQNFIDQVRARYRANPV